MLRESKTALRFGACNRSEWCWYTSPTLRMIDTGGVRREGGMVGRMGKRVKEREAKRGKWRK